MNNKKPIGIPMLDKNDYNADRPIEGSFPSFSALSTGMLPYNCLYSTYPQMVYPPYPYSTYPYSNNQYIFNGANQWREHSFNPVGIPNHIKYSYNSGFLENPRVAPRKTADRVQEIINLQSEEEIVHEPILPPSQNNNQKTTGPKKKIDVILIEDNSQNIQENTPKDNTPQLIIEKQKQKISLFSPLDHVEPAKNPDNSQKQKAEGKQKQKLQKFEYKTKPIRKAKKKSMLEVSKSERSSREKSRIQQNSRIKTREDKQQRDFQKAVEQTYKRSQRNQRKSMMMFVKKKTESSNVRQIAKYLESHGQIRHGKQFQTSIPDIKNFHSLQTIGWIQLKRKNILDRQIVNSTY